MRLHIIGICGTFMGGLALIARQLGHQVSGSDQNVYPPMSTQLLEQGITLKEGYQEENLADKPDLVIIGNALSRGNPEVEAVLNLGLRYLSGPQWLAEYVLYDRWVLGVSGTHGKTTTTSMLAWILEDQGLKPGFLIGGIPLNFGLSARLGEAPYFVIEADEYDTAFFDKRSKFVHYRPRTLVINNLEYDHADIFPDLPAIQRQFHHLIRTVPGQGLIISPTGETSIDEVISLGCWTAVEQTAIDQASDWKAILDHQDGTEFNIHFDRKKHPVKWDLTGRHNVFNALSAVAAAHHAGINLEDATGALSRFKNVKRRMEVIAKIDKVTIYDDFAHHPTAIATTLNGLRKQVNNERIIAVLEPRSNTMRMGTHADQLPHSLGQADRTLIFQSFNLNWDLQGLEQEYQKINVYDSLDEIIKQLVMEARHGGHFIIMSNGSFDGLHQKLLKELQL